MTTALLALWTCCTGSYSPDINRLWNAPQQLPIHGRRTTATASTRSKHRALDLGTLFAMQHPGPIGPTASHVVHAHSKTAVTTGVAAKIAFPGGCRPRPDPLSKPGPPDRGIRRVPERPIRLHSDL